MTSTFLLESHVVNWGCARSVVRMYVLPEVSQVGYSIGIGASPIGDEGFVQPEKGQGEAKLN